VRIDMGDPAPIAVALITETPDGYAWRTLATTATLTGSVARARVDVKTLSCAPGAGLEQPDLVFGFVRVPDGDLLLDVRPMITNDSISGHWDVTSFGTAHAGFFMYALRPGVKPPGDGFELLVVSEHEVNRPGGPSPPVAVVRLPVKVPSVSFAHLDLCGGEALAD
jgi:hypothetical protein